MSDDTTLDTPLTENEFLTMLLNQLVSLNASVMRIEFNELFVDFTLLFSGPRHDKRKWSYHWDGWQAVTQQTMQDMLVAL
jgi:hypothetical protein